MSDKTGGAAFARPMTRIVWDNGNQEISTEQDGMTLRDYFAANAPNPPSGWTGTCGDAEKLYRQDGKIAALIEWRWFYADAMIAEREKP